LKGTYITTIETETSLSKTQQRKEKIFKVISILRERFPKTCGMVPYKRKPLELRIFDDIVVAIPELDPKEVDIALAAYCGTTAYLRGVVYGRLRVDLDGVKVAETTPEERTAATAILYQRALKRERRLEQEKIEQAKKLKQQQEQAAANIVVVEEAKV
jgi:sRNA-binding protein